MTTINELMYEYEQARDEFDFNMDKISVFIEAVTNDYELNLRRAKVKIMEESGTYNDFFFLEDKAKEESNNKFTNAIKAMIENFKKFVNNITTKIKNFFKQHKIQSMLDRAEDAFKTNLKLRSKLVKTDDIKTIAKAHKKMINELNRCIIAATNGSSKPVPDAKHYISELKSSRDEIIQSSEKRELSASQLCSDLKWCKDELSNLDPEKYIQVIHPEKRVSMNLTELANGYLNASRDYINTLWNYLYTNLAKINSILAGETNPEDVTDKPKVSEVLKDKKEDLKDKINDLKEKKKQKKEAKASEEEDNTSDVDKEEEGNEKETEESVTLESIEDELGFGADIIETSLEDIELELGLA